MPSRNVVKVDLPETFYHVYARGHSRQKIFLDQSDYTIFLALFKRYLSAKPQADSYGALYQHLFDKVELVCFCLMPNHFHLLIYQRDEGSLQSLMRGVMTSYSRYFNKRYHHSGALFESRYKAAMVTTDSYLQHASRYIHLNRRDWQETPYSSIDYYLGKRRAEWLRPERVMAYFDGPREYDEFVSDYEANKAILDELKYDLANESDITPQNKN